MIHLNSVRRCYYIFPPLLDQQDLTIAIALRRSSGNLSSRQRNQCLCIALLSARNACCSLNDRGGWRETEDVCSLHDRGGWPEDV